MVDRLHFPSGTRVNLGPEIGRGGEGTVFEVLGAPDLVAKVYTDGRADDRREKIEAMVAAGLHRKAAHISFPIDALLDDKDRFVGFTMRKIRDARPIHQLWGSRDRQEKFPKATVEFMVRAAGNVARAVAELHYAGCVIGDINESGFLVTEKATVVLIDSDSIQFTVGNRVFPCVVGTPQYLPPEHQAVNQRQLSSRVANHDSFGLAVMIFRLLMVGTHPFMGKWNGGGDPPALPKWIEEFRYAYGADATRMKVGPQPSAPPVDWLSDEIRAAFDQAFGKSGVQARPTAADWIGLLDRFEKSLVPCGRSRFHHYRPGARYCPWCETEKTRGKALFGAPPPPPPPPPPNFTQQPFTTTATPTAPGPAAAYSPPPPPPNNSLRNTAIAIVGVTIAAIWMFSGGGSRQVVAVPVQSQPSAANLGAANVPQKPTPRIQNHVTGEYQYTESFQSTTDLLHAKGGTWSLNGARAIVDQSQLRILTEETDKGGWVSFHPSGNLSGFTLSMQNFFHPSNEYYFGRTNLVLTNSDGAVGQIELAALRSNYGPDYDSKQANFDRPRVIASNANGVLLRQFLSMRSSSAYNQWHSMQVSWNGLTGVLDLDFDGDGISDLKSEIPGLKDYSLTEIRLDAYGWWTGHYRSVDDFYLAGNAAGVDAAQKQDASTQSSTPTTEVMGLPSPEKIGLLKAKLNMRGCDAGPINDDFDARLIHAIKDFALANSLDWENPKAQVGSIIYQLDRADSKYCKTVAPGSGPAQENPGTSEPSSTQTQVSQKWAVTDRSSEDALGLNRRTIAEVQARLEAMDFDPNGIDGVPGQGYRGAIKAWQASSGIPATGYLDSTQLSELKFQSEVKLRSWLKNTGNAQELTLASDPISPDPTPTKKAAVNAPAAPTHGGWYRRSDGQYCKDSENANWASWTCQSWKPRAW